MKLVILAHRMFSHLFGLSLSCCANSRFPYMGFELKNWKVKRSKRNVRGSAASAASAEAKYSRERGERRVTALCPKARRGEWQSSRITRCALRERYFLFNTSLASLTLTQGTNLFTYNLYENIVCNKKVRRINKWIYFLSESLRFGFVEK